ncbi:MAG: aspartyl-tRNA(Asn)/glutamyl-tRNA (Gln) amidotransferase subunit B [Parcubacteria group bacterium Athens1014_26]|nr:MAG: aspartyl-tRNA(Asn)/glutamyl-tRNA (Gln) amidotransferase subunit B [Parcubacteria group bacterium Athens1014_26]
MGYKPTIGLEIHAELKTATKMFCGCLNDPDEKHPNVNVCPVCLGHPGVLPTINKKAVKSIIKVGMAIKGEINEVFRFDRKNYFYPDLPKGYQISQFEQPIVKGGEVDISARAGKPGIVKITRIHLEEDAGKLVHDIGGPSTGSGRQASLVDFNRGGMPLMELVTEPVIHDAKEAVFFAKELQLILRYLEVSDADMEKGQMRVDANVSVSKDDVLGVKVEIKNLNSFRAVEQALNYEIKRQQKVLEEGGKIEQETRGWNDAKQKTESQRSKEESHDYRYFPEPDLPSLVAEDFDLGVLRLEITELPNEKRERLKKQYELNANQIDFLIEDKESAEFFEKAVSELEADEQRLISKEKIKLIINYLATDLTGLMKEGGISFKELMVSPENFADLIEMIDKKEVSSRIAKDLLYKMAKTGGDPRQIVKEEGLHQVSGEEELIVIVNKIIEENSGAVADYKKGKTTALQFLVGKAMAALRGKGNPQVLQKLFRDNL